MNKINAEIKNQLLDNAPCGYLQIDGVGLILGMNKTLRSWLGYEIDEALNINSIEDLFSIGGKIYCQTHLLPLLKMQGEVSEINLSMERKNTTTFSTLINAKRDDYTSENVQTYSVFVVNITQRKLYEKELLKARKKADDAVRKLKQVNRDLEQFAFTASHDLQSPLRTISGMIYLLEKKKFIKPDTEEAKLFSLIKSNSNQMRLMIRDLLEYSKMEDNQANHSPVSINEVCQQAINMLRDDIEKNQAVFDISLVPVVSGSKSQLVRLFQNLFENSIKYRSDAAPEIVVTSLKIDDYCQISVKDNGIGFDMTSAKDIFSFMKRLQTDQNIPGTGIGLSACKRIMENHGGSISAESEPGKGSVFKLQFPIK